MTWELYSCLMGVVLLYDVGAVQLFDMGVVLLYDVGVLGIGCFLENRQSIYRSWQCQTNAGG